MIYTVNKKQYEVPVERVHAALTVYDTWMRGLHGRPISRRERLVKIEAISALLAPRQWQGDDGLMHFDYYAPDRLNKVLLSEIGKRSKNSRKPDSLPLFER